VANLYRNRWVWFAGFFFLLALGLRIYHLDFNGLWNDEFQTERLANLSWPMMAKSLYLQKSNPPVYFSIQKIFLSVFGDSEFSLRFPSALYSSAGAVVFFLIALQLGLNLEFAVAVGFLLSFNLASIYYGQEARPYALVFLLSAITLAIRNFWIDHPSQRRLIGYITAGLLLILTHYFAALFVLTLFGADLFSVFQKKSKPKNIFKIRVAAVLILILAGFFAYLLTRIHIEWIAELNHGLVDIFRGFIGLPIAAAPRIPFRWSFDSVLVGLALGSLVLLRLKLESRRRQKLLGIFASFWLPLIFVQIAKFFGIHLFMDRFFIFCLGSFWILIALSAFELPAKKWIRRTLIWGLTVSQILLVIGESYYLRDTKESWRSVATSLKDEMPVAESAVILCQWTRYYQYYFRRLQIQPAVVVESCSVDSALISRIKQEHPEIRNFYLVYGHLRFKAVNVESSWQLVKELHLNRAGYLQLREGID
jgi:4-amino-4-deoxy-L-arabinose transferase-like glycosyltransferase